MRDQKEEWARAKMKIMISGTLEEHREKIKLAVRKHREKYKKELAAKARHRMANDPCWKLQQQQTNKLRRAMREPYYNGYIEHLGCTAQQFRAWISAQFTKGMKWKNYGRYDPKRKTWSLDHLCPLSRAEGDIEKLIPLLHFKNIRPFDSRENLIERGR